MARDPASAEPEGGDVPEGAGDQAGADATARLLLALTALYVQRSNHTAQEQQQYTELALGLIERASPDTRAIVAARLQRHPDAPAAVIERCVSAADPSVPAGGDGGNHDQTLFAQDQDLFAAAGPDPDGASLPAVSGSDLSVDPFLDPFVAWADAAPAGTEPRPDAASATSVPLPSASAPALPPETGEAFFAAPPDERRRMLSELGAAAGDDPGDGRRFHVRIDTAPWQGRTGAFARDFARLIDAPMSLCNRILDDPWGEPMVVAARAAGMPVAVLQRILLLVSPTRHHSVQRVYDLTELYYALDGRTARALLAAWRSAAVESAETSAGAEEPPPANHLPVPVAAANAGATDIRARLRALNARIEGKGGRRAD